MKWKGQITIFVTLLFLTMIPFMLLFVQLAQKESAEAYFLYAAKSARENLKASYCREFFEEYDLFVVWETQVNPEKQLQEILQKYEDPSEGYDYYWIPFITFQEPSVDIYSYQMATDEMGRYLEEQIIAAEKENIALEAVFAAVDSVQDYVDGTGMIENIPEMFESGENNLQSGDMETEKDLPEENESETLSLKESLKSVSLVELVESLKEKPVLTILSGTEKISERVIPFPCGNMEDGWETGNKYELELYEKYLVCSYIRKHFEDYLDGTEAAAFYETEYILSGKGSDQENVEKALEKFIGWKGAINLVAALGNSALVQRAEELSATVLGWLGSPTVTEGGKLILLAALSYGEAIVDGRRLLSGKRVALLKGEEDWKLNFENAGTILSDPSSCMEDDKEGICYEEYLVYLMFLEDLETIRIRMMEVMQWNMQQENTIFLLEHCICGVSYEMRANSAKNLMPVEERWRNILHHDSLVLGIS